jgi:hypothetical protein
MDSFHRVKLGSTEAVSEFQRWKNEVCTIRCVFGFILFEFVVRYAVSVGLLLGCFFFDTLLTNGRSGAVMANSSLFHN